MASPLRDITNVVQDVAGKVSSLASSTARSDNDGGVEYRDGQTRKVVEDSALEPETPVRHKVCGVQEVENADSMASKKQAEGLQNDDSENAAAQQVNDQAPPLPPQQHAPPTNTALSDLGLDVPHPQTAEIVRQTEYYFSDGNLVQDAHLLARTGITGDGWVSINEIMGFGKMRKFKPRSKVKAAIATSKMLEVDGKFIRRKEPLKTAPRVEPKADPKRERDRLLQEKPWLSKAMLEPTGFEAYATEGPISPAQFREERKLFDPEEAFTTRIEYAATRFAGRKKMHQASARTFDKFMLLGGFVANSYMFAGAMSKKELEQYDKEQVLQMTAKLSVSESVVNGLNPDSADAGSWVVDFVGMAKAFLSSELLQHFDWSDEKVVHDSTNVLRKFYEYLLYHDACPEYEDDIYDAIDVCDVADIELPKLAKLSQYLPGNFNMAVSTLQSGFYAQVRPQDTAAEWLLPGDHIGLADADARLIFSAGLMAHASEQQIDAVYKAQAENVPLLVTTEEDIGLEILRVEKVSETAKKIYEDDRVKGTLIKPTGKLYCKRWYHPGAAPDDLPSEVKAQAKKKKREQYEFILEAEILELCEPGMKLEANVSRMANGVMWLDLIENVYPTFFTWTHNERIRDWKEPGPPKRWMQRVSAQEQGEKTQSVVKSEPEDEMLD